MVNNIVTYLNAQLSLLDYFEKSHCLSELITKGEETFPAEYIEKGNFQNIELDNSNGVSYWRKSGDITTEEVENAVGCERLLDYVLPLRLVAAVPKIKLSEDDAYSADRIGKTIIKQLEQNARDLRSQIKARNIIIHVDSYSTDNAQIISDEYGGGSREVKYDMAYLALEVTVTITITKACLLAECDDKDDDILHIFDFCDQSVVNRLTDEQQICLIAALCGAIAMDCANVNDNVTGLTQAVRQQVQRVNPLLTGQTTSYAAGDDGDLEKGRLVNYLTLDCNNEFGNTNRFTNSKGGSVDDGTDGSIVAYMIDHATGLGWFSKAPLGLKNWADAVAFPITATDAGFSDWRTPNAHEAQQLNNNEIINPKSGTILTANMSFNFWTSTTLANSTGNAYSSNNNGELRRVTKVTINSSIILCRNHY